MAQNNANGTAAQANGSPKEEELLQPVGPGADEGDAPRQDRQDGAAGDDYNYPEGDDEDGSARAGEERAGHAEHDEPDEHGEGAGQGRSREQRRRQRKREKYDRDQRELTFLRSRNEQLERRFSDIEHRVAGSDVMQIDGRIAQTQSDLREADTLFAQAVKSGDEGSIAEALRVRDDLRDGLNRLQFTKDQTVRQAQARREQAANPGPDPEVSHLAAEWARENSWFDPNLRDTDSRYAKAEEEALFREGRLDPRSHAYWDELTARLARRMPERFERGRPRDEEDEDEDESDARGRNRSNAPGRRDEGNRSASRNDGGSRRPTGPEIRVGGRERPLRKGEVFIDKDRREAMEEAGVWHDPALRQKYLDQYARYDREHGGRRRQH